MHLEPHSSHHEYPYLSYVAIIEVVVWWLHRCRPVVDVDAWHSHGYVEVCLYQVMQTNFNISLRTLAQACGRARKHVTGPCAAKGVYKHPFHGAFYS